MKNIVLFVLLALLTVPAFAGDAPAEEGLSEKAFRPNNDVVGSWFGRAVPNNPPCPPGVGDCFVPHEIVMLPTFYADGNFLGIDSQVFGGGDHSTAHGEWIRTGPGKIEASWVFLQGGEDLPFVGAFRMRMVAENISRDVLHGYVNAWFFPFVGEDGLVITDPDSGNPVPDPLIDLGPFIFDGGDCDPAVGCFGVFEFTIRRVSVN